MPRPAVANQTVFEVIYKGDRHDPDGRERVYASSHTQQEAVNYAREAFHSYPYVRVQRVVKKVRQIMVMQDEE
jgi:hypothetical protein